MGMFGDGSLGMSAGELETLVRLDIPAVLLHFNNGMFGWIKALQMLHGRQKYQSVDFKSGDMSKLAAALGLASYRAATPDELDDCLNEAFRLGGPVFIDVVTASEVEELPPVYSWQKQLNRRQTRTSARINGGDAIIVRRTT